MVSKAAEPLASLLLLPQCCLPFPNAIVCLHLVIISDSQYLWDHSEKPMMMPLFGWDWCTTVLLLTDNQPTIMMIMMFVLLLCCCWWRRCRLSAVDDVGNVDEDIMLVNYWWEYWLRLVISLDSIEFAVVYYCFTASVQWSCSGDDLQCWDHLRKF